MYYISIHTFAEMASFRIPETHTFQQTLPLPPLTTLIGMLGAALGLPFQEAMKFYEDNILRFGVIGTHTGRVNDLWKYRKVKADEVISAVLLREYLVDLDLYIYIATETIAVMKRIRDSFLDPVYALTAGNSDHLYKIKEISQVSQISVEPLSEVSFTMLSGDHSNNYESNIDIRTVPLLREIYAPTVHLLPTQFDFYGEERRIKSRKPFTFIGTPIRLKQIVPGIQVDGKAVPLI